MGSVLECPDIGLCSSLVSGSHQLSQVTSSVRFTLRSSAAGDSCSLDSPVYWYASFARSSCKQNSLGRATEQVRMQQSFSASSLLPSGQRSSTPANSYMSPRYFLH